MSFFSTLLAKLYFYERKDNSHKESIEQAKTYIVTLLGLNLATGIYYFFTLSSNKMNAQIFWTLKLLIGLIVPLILILLATWMFKKNKGNIREEFNDIITGKTNISLFWNVIVSLYIFASIIGFISIPIDLFSTF